MTRKQKLELTWIGKENRPRLEPRILLQDLEKACHALHRVTAHDIFDNRLILGDDPVLTKRGNMKPIKGRMTYVFKAYSNQEYSRVLGSPV